MVASVEVGEGGVALLVGNGLLKEHETRDRKPSVRRVLRRWSDGPWAVVRDFFNLDRLLHEL